MCLADAGSSHRSLIEALQLFAPAFTQVAYQNFNHLQRGRVLGSGFKFYASRLRRFRGFRVRVWGYFRAVPREDGRENNGTMAKVDVDVCPAVEQIWHIKIKQARLDSIFGFQGTGV